MKYGIFSKIEIHQNSRKKGKYKPSYKLIIFSPYPQSDHFHRITIQTRKTKEWDVAFYSILRIRLACRMFKIQNA